MVSIARIERPPLHRGGSASTETMPAVSPLPFRACSPSLLEGGLIGLPLRATFSPAHPLARRDVPLAQARAFRFSHFPLGGAARLSFTARIEGAHSDRAASASKKDGLAAPFPPSELVALLSLEGGLFGLLLRATFSPTGTPRRAISPGEGPPILFTSR